MLITQLSPNPKTAGHANPSQLRQLKQRQQSSICSDFVNKSVHATCLELSRTSKQLVKGAECLSSSPAACACNCFSLFLYSLFSPLLLTIHMVSLSSRTVLRSASSCSLSACARACATEPYARVVCVWSSTDSVTGVENVTVYDHEQVDVDANAANAQGHKQGVRRRRQPIDRRNCRRKAEWRGRQLRPMAPD